MIKQAPRPLQIAVMAGFVLSCFAVLLYLWLAFGGTVPLRPESYRIEARFPEATQLAQQADVRIAGVPVGKVIAIDPTGENRTKATIELQTRFAPIPRDARAMLRQKTLLGETYVDLAPGNRRAGMLPDGGTLPDGAIAPTVELDEIFRTFDPETREAFRTWMQAGSAGVEGRGADINAAFGTLPELTDGADRLLRDLDAQRRALGRVFATTGDFFDAISEREGQLSGLITGTERVFGVTARRDRELAAIFERLPRFERESRLTLPRLTRFAQTARPMLERLDPVADELAPTFAEFERLAPELRGFFERLGPVIGASRRAAPAFDRFAERIPPLFADFGPFLRNLDPSLRHLARHRPEITAFLANTTGATLARDINLPRTQDPVQQFRTSQILAPQALGFLPRPLGSTRSNAYPVPGSAELLPRALESYDVSGCENGDPAPPESADPPTLTPLVALYAFRTPGRDVARPPCVEQGPYPGFEDAFPRLEADGR